MQYRGGVLALEVVVACLLSLSGLSPTLAQAEGCQPSSGGIITCASVDDVKNSVLLYSFARKKNQEHVRRGTLLFPQEMLDTLSDSSAEIQFNDGSIASSESETSFLFHPNSLNIQLIDGKILIKVSRGGRSKVQTTVATVEAPGTAFSAGTLERSKNRHVVATVKPSGIVFWVSHRAGRKETLVKVLTNSPLGSVTVTSKKGQTVTLRAGQSVTVTSEKIAPVQEFDLQAFSESHPLGGGLRPGPEAGLPPKSPIGPQTPNATPQGHDAAITAQPSPTRATVSSTRMPRTLPLLDSNSPAEISSPSLYYLDSSSTVQPWNDPNPPTGIPSPSLYYLDPSSAVQPGNVTRIAPN